MLNQNGPNGHTKEHQRAFEWAAQVAPFYAPLVPHTGARLHTIVGPAQTLAKVFLAPGAGLSRIQRRYAEAHPLVTCCVRGDPGTQFLPAPHPTDFNAATLRWAFRGAEYVAIWSAAFPEHGDEYARWAIETAKAARFITTVETTSRRVSEWAFLAELWKRCGVPVRFFGPEESAVESDNPVDLHSLALWAQNFRSPVQS